MSLIKFLSSFKCSYEYFNKQFFLKSTKIVTLGLFVVNTQTFGNTCALYFDSNIHSNFSYNINSGLISGSSSKSKIRNNKEKATNPWGLVTANQFQLTDSIIQDVLKRENLMQLKTEYQNGRGLGFRFSKFILGSMNTYAPGEVVQTAFMAKLIQLIFPEARILHSDESIYGLKKVIDLAIDDHNEHNEHLVNERSTFPISFVKIANTTSSFLRNQKGNLRNLFSLSLNKKIIHIYTSIDDDKSSQDRRLEDIELIREVKSKNPNAIIILSSLNILLDRDLLLLREFEGAVKLTEIENLREVPTFVLNDTIGLMPYIHAVSDVVIVKGPVNFFEPLHVGTPLVITNTENSLKYFNSQGFEEMKETALSTNGAWEENDVSQIGHKVLDIFRDPTYQIILPSDVNITPKTQEKDIFYDFLYSYLKQKLEAKKF